MSAFAAHATDLAIPIDGPPLLVAAEKPGQGSRLAFSAQAGQHLGFAVTGLKFVPSSATGIGFTVKQSDGSVLRGAEMIYCVANNADSACDGEFTVGKSGAHTIDVDVPFSAAPRFSIQLSSAVTRRLTIGKSEAVTLSRAGQDGWFPLAVGAGQDLAVELRDVASSAKPGRFALRVYRPDGALVGEGSADSRSPASVALGSSAVAGTYFVEVDPDHGATGSFVVAAKAAAQSAEGAIPISSAANQPLRFSFAATAGQSVTVGVDNIVHDPDVDSNSLLQILNPDGTRLAGLGCKTLARGGGRLPCRVSASDLAAGNYTIVVSPPPGASVAGKLYRTTDIVAKLDPSSPARVDVQPGQVARFTFSANAGDKVGVKVQRVLPDDKKMIYVRLMGPNTGFGTRVLMAAESTMVIEPVAMPATGTYTIAVDAQFNKASASVSLIR